MFAHKKKILAEKKNPKLASVHQKKQVCAHLKINSSQMVYIGKRQRYTSSAPNNSNETYTFMCLGRAGRFRQLVFNVWGRI